MKRILLLLPLICLVIPGCLLLSLQPYYEEDDIVDHRAFVGKFPVLTATPAELQAFILKHFKTEGAFEDMDLKRVTPSEY